MVRCSAPYTVSYHLGNSRVDGAGLARRAARHPLTTSHGVGVGGGEGDPGSPARLSIQWERHPHTGSQISNQRNAIYESPPKTSIPCVKSTSSTTILVIHFPPWPTH